MDLGAVYRPRSPRGAAKDREAEGVRAACTHHAWSADPAVSGDGTGLRTQFSDWAPLEPVRADAGGAHKRERPTLFRKAF